MVKKTKIKKSIRLNDDKDLTFKINFKCCKDEKIIDGKDFFEFLQSKIKIDNKLNNLKDNMNIKLD